MRFSVIFLFVSVALAGAGGAKILALFAFPSKSHFVMLEALAKGLAARGHQVTVVGHFPQKTPIPNYTDISLAGTVKQIVNNVTVDYIYERWRDPWSTIDFIWREAGVGHCEMTYKNRVFQDLIRQNKEYDLLITELWGSDCFLPLANVFGVPHISLITTMEVPWSVGRYGSSYNPAYRVNHFFPYSPRGMSTWERLMNTVHTAVMNIGYLIYSESPSEDIAKKYLGSSVKLSDVVKESSLLFVNSHFSMIGARPFVPNIVEVGGLHITEPKPLPELIQKTSKQDNFDAYADNVERKNERMQIQVAGPRSEDVSRVDLLRKVLSSRRLSVSDGGEPDVGPPLPGVLRPNLLLHQGNADIKKFLDEAEEGAILFSFGSLIRADTLKKEILDIFVEVFRSLPQKVLWKINGHIRNQPGNVKTVEWLPQCDVLRHPNVKIFITHGGLMGTQEAVTAGVPMLGIPFFADQRFNILNYQELGFAINLELEDITAASFADALQKLLSDPRYTQQAKHYSDLFMDRPQTPLETAIYWTEYVIRHKGASHMRSPAVKLNFFQYYLLDVLLIILVPVFVTAKCVTYLRRIRRIRKLETSQERRTRLERKNN